MKRIHQLSKTLQALIAWDAFKLRLFFEGILVGFVVGLIIGSFVWVLHQASVIRQFIYQSYITPALFAGNWLPFIGWIVFALLLSLIIYRLCIYETMAMGGGIPQVKGELLGIFHMKWLSVLYVKFIGVVLGILGGLSIGREAPSVQIGAAAAKGISRLFGRFPLEEKYLITSGSSAGLAAAFSAPLAGTVFALEEMNQSFSSAVLLPSMAAAVTATMVTRYIFGESALFIFPTMPDSTIALIIPIILVGAICGPFGVLYNYGLTHVGLFYKKISLHGVWSRLFFALVIGAFVCLWLPEITEGGDDLVNSIVANRPGLLFLILLFIGKYIFTILSTGSGIPGGFLVPMFALGGLLGAIESSIFISVGILDPIFSNNIVTAAMAAFVTASMRSPITSVLLILELTGDFSHLTTLVLASAIAYVTSALVGGKPIYGELLSKALSKHPKTTKKARTLIEVPVGPGSYLENKQIKEIAWPTCSTVVEIKNGEHTLIPTADVRLSTGMILYVLTLPSNSPQLLKMGQS